MQGRQTWGDVMTMLRYAAAVSVAAVLLLVTAAARAADVSGAGWQKPEDWFIYAVIIVVFVLFLVILAIVRDVLGRGGSAWSLADALSEEVDLSVPDANGKPYSVNGQVVKATEMRASSSRLIAFLGTLAILLLFMGFGVFILWNFAHTGEIKGANDIQRYLLGGLTLFAPYVVNKFASIFAPK